MVACASQVETVALVGVSIISAAHGNGWNQSFFPGAFYSGDAWGSFNSLMRLLTGILFGLGIVWYTYPYLDKAFSPRDRFIVVRADSKETNTPEKYTV
jgi:hypothetical protein